MDMVLVFWFWIKTDNTAYPAFSWDVAIIPLFCGQRSKQSSYWPNKNDLYEYEQHRLTPSAAQLKARRAAPCYHKKCSTNVATYRVADTMTQARDKLVQYIPYSPFSTFIGQSHNAGRGWGRPPVVTVGSYRGRRGGQARGRIFNNC